MASCEEHATALTTNQIAGFFDLMVSQTSGPAMVRTLTIDLALEGRLIHLVFQSVRKQSCHAMPQYNLGM